MDSYIPDLAACITDENEIVRGQALALLANLLQKVCHAKGEGVGWLAVLWFGGCKFQNNTVASSPYTCLSLTISYSSPPPTPHPSPNA